MSIFSWVSRGGEVRFADGAGRATSTPSVATAEWGGTRKPYGVFKYLSAFWEVSETIPGRIARPYCGFPLQRAIVLTP